MSNFRNDVYGKFMNIKLLSLIPLGRVPYKLNKHSKYEIGKTYWCGYWEQLYTVLSVNTDNSKVKVVWDDGRVVEHSTSLDIRHDYEIKPLKYNYVDAVINGKRSYTSAEIKALIYLHIIDDETADAIINQYYNKDHVPNDYTYFYVRVTKNNGETKVRLKRDMNKSPHNFYNIKTVEDLFNDTRIALYEFVDMEGIELDVEPRYIPESTNVLGIKYISGAKYAITLEAIQRDGLIYYGKEVERCE